MKAPRIAIYGRVSTDAQNHEGQLGEVREYVARRWPDAQCREILDTASGSKSSRQGLDGLMREVRKGRVDVVVCYKLDRLGRSLQHLAALIGELDTHRTSLVCTSQGIDTSDSNPAGRLQMNVLAAVAEFERSLIIERTKSGLAAARARGSVLGRKRTLDARKDEVAALLAQGHSLRATATLTGLPAGSVATIARRLKKAV